MVLDVLLHLHGRIGPGRYGTVATGTSCRPGRARTWPSSDWRQVSCPLPGRGTAGWGFCPWLVMGLADGEHEVGTELCECLVFGCDALLDQLCRGGIIVHEVVGNVLQRQGQNAAVRVLLHEGEVAAQR